MDKPPLNTSDTHLKITKHGVCEEKSVISDLL